MSDKLQRLIDLVKRTGDRLVIHDPVSGNDIVIMDVDTYESLVSNKVKKTDFQDKNKDQNLPEYTNDALPDEPFINPGVHSWQDMVQKARKNYQNSESSEKSTQTIDLGGVSFTKTTTKTTTPNEQNTQSEPEYSPISPEPVMDEHVFRQGGEGPKQVPHNEDDPVFFEEPV